jgi:uncharacterized protein YecE (DUF72 family)
MAPHHSIGDGTRGRSYIGTSGWSYSHWAKGRFYPKGLRQGEWLRYFSEHFCTVEVNMTFYRLPRPELVERWRQVPSCSFLFTLKVWRRITHEKRLKDCREPLAQFLNAAESLRERRGPLLVQLPPSMQRDSPLLDEFLAELKDVGGATTWRVAVEFRNQTWLDDAVNTVLDKHDAALCLADMPRCPIVAPNNASFVYLRRHGPGGRYRGCYSERHLTEDAVRIRAWLDTGRDVYVYFNNDLEGHAIDNARRLQELVDA